MLEDIVCWISKACQKAVYEYHEKHLNTSSYLNPNRRDLTIFEKQELDTCPMLQGTFNRIALKQLAKCNREPRIALSDVYEMIITAAFNDQYINELVAYVCWLASYYIELKFAFRGKYTALTDFRNPNSRILTDVELDRCLRFPMISSITDGIAVKKISKINHTPTIPFSELAKKILT